MVNSIEQERHMEIEQIVEYLYNGDIRLKAKVLSRVLSEELLKDKKLHEMLVNSIIKIPYVLTNISNNSLKNKKLNEMLYDYEGKAIISNKRPKKCSNLCPDETEIFILFTVMAFMKEIDYKTVISEYVHALNRPEAESQKLIKHTENRFNEYNEAMQRSDFGSDISERLENIIEGICSRASKNVFRGRECDCLKSLVTERFIETKTFSNNFLMTFYVNQCIPEQMTTRRPCVRS